MSDHRRGRWKAKGALTKKSKQARDAERFFGRGKVAQFYVVRGGDPRLFHGIMSGDEMTMRFLELIGKFLGETSKRKVGKQMLCLSCPQELPVYPPAFVITVPFMANWIKDGGAAVVTGICPTCAQKTDDELGDAALKAFGGQELTPGTG